MNNYFRSLGKKLRNTSVKIKVLGITMSLVILMGISSNFIIRELLVIKLSEDLERRAVSISSDLSSRSADLAILQDIYNLDKLLEHTKNNNPDIEYIFILDNQGENVLIHTLGRELEVTKELIKYNNVDNMKNQEYKITTFQSERGMIHDVVTPILGGDVGFVRVGLNENQIKNTINDLTFIIIMMTTVIAIIGFIISFILTSVIYKDLMELIYASKEVGKGNLNRKVKIESNDEIGLLGKEFNVMIDQLKKKNNQNQAYLQELKYKEELRLKLLERVISAQEEERKRIARELHDETSQSLASLVIGLSMLEDTNTDQKVKGKIEHLKNITEKMIDEVHYISWSLRPSALDDYGLLPAIKRYAHEFMEKYGIEVDIEVIGFDGIRLPSVVEISIYRVIQEALTNASRHANAENISIILKCQKDIVSFIIEDDGKGFDVSETVEQKLVKDHLGLKGMQERIESIGGHFFIESIQEIGTSIYVTDIKIGGIEIDS